MWLCMQQIDEMFT